MNVYSTVIVSDANKAAAQQVISDLYSTEESESTHGENYFGVELDRDGATFWASSGHLYSDEATALVDSGSLEYIHFGDSFDQAIASRNMTKIEVDEGIE